MGKIIVKKPRHSLTAQRFAKFGRQSIMRGVYQDKPVAVLETVTQKEEKKPKLEDKKKENTNNVMMMDTKQKIDLANEVLAEEAQVKAKRIKKDKGLIERKENTIILTEDNRELLND